MTFTPIYATTAAATPVWYIGTAGTTTTNTTWQIGGAWVAVQGSAATAMRQAPPREFNRYVNASDLVEEFIAWLGTQRVRQGEVMGLPLELFIKWLIIRACEEDQEEPNVVLALPPKRDQPRCLGCGRFVARKSPVALCRAMCADLHFHRADACHTKMASELVPV